MQYASAGLSAHLRPYTQEIRTDAKPTMPELPQMVYECATTGAPRRQRRETVQRLTAADRLQPVTNGLLPVTANLAETYRPA